MVAKAIASEEFNGGEKQECVELAEQNVYFILRKRQILYKDYKLPPKRSN